MKFKNLDKAQVGSQAVSRVEFPEIAPLVTVDADGNEQAEIPWLEVRCAGEANRAFTQASLRAPGAQRLLRSKLTPQEVTQDRAEAIPLYADHILTGNGGGWTDDASGAAVQMPLKSEDRLALLKQLPVDLFDRVRRHCNDLCNFRG